MLEMLSVGGPTAHRFDALTTTTNYQKQLGNLEAGMKIANVGLFAQDAWRVRALTGVPIDATFGRDINLSQGGPDRPYSAPGVPFQRNAFRNLGFKDVNLRLQWRPSIGGRSVSLMADFFNVFNWNNIQLSGGTVTNYCAGTAPLDCGFGAPTNPNFLSTTDQTPGSATLGQLIQTNTSGAPRQIQLGFRFKF